MKVPLSAILFINVLLRVHLLFIMFRDTEKSRRGVPKKPFKNWMDPLAKRVFLINVNGLGSGFLALNATPFIQEMVRDYGASGGLITSYFETDEGGLGGILTGKPGLSSPVYTRFDPNCIDTLLNYVDCKCITGTLIEGIRANCSYSTNYPLRKVLELPKLFDPKNRMSCLYVINYNIDPVLVYDYKSKLEALDTEIRVLATTVNKIWNDNGSTFIITSGRGSPVGESLTNESPFVAWGKGIAVSFPSWHIHRGDLAAMICVLLGSNFPTHLRGIVPTFLMSLSEYHDYEWTHYTLKHFEAILELVRFDDEVISAAELEPEQLLTRLYKVLIDVQKEEANDWSVKLGFLIAFHFVSGLHLLAVSSAGSTQITVRVFTVTKLFVVFLSLYLFSPSNCEFKMALAFVLWLLLQSNAQVRQEWRKFGFKCMASWLLIVVAFVCVVALEFRKTLSVLLASVALLPVLKCTFFQLNRFVLLGGVASALILGILPFSKVYGEMPDAYVTAFISLLFLIQYNVLLNAFNKSIDSHDKVVHVVALVTAVHLKIMYTYDFRFINQLASAFLLLVFLGCLYFTSGTTVERFIKILSACVVPVQMFAIRIELVFLFAIVLHMFCWVFTEYHDSQSVLQLNPGIFSVQPEPAPKPAPFSIRLIYFYLVYCYVAYYASGHHPHLHSYEFYDLPHFFYRHFLCVSQFLALFKFFLPFFVVTLAFVTFKALRKEDGDFQMTTFVWASDVIGILFIFYYEFVSRMFPMLNMTPKFSCFGIQQFAAVSAVAAYYLSKWLLFGSRLGPDFFFMLLKDSVRWQRNQHKSEAEP